MVSACYNLYMWSPLDGHLSCFWFGTIVNKDDVYIHAQVFVWTCAFISLGLTTKRKTPRAYEKCMVFFCLFFFFKLYITVLVLPNIKMNPPQVYMCSPS